MSKVEKLIFNGIFWVLIPTFLIWIGIAILIAFYYVINAGLLLVISSCFSYLYWYYSTKYWIRMAMNSNISKSDIFTVGRRIGIICNMDQIERVFEDNEGSIHKSVSFRFHQYFFGERPS